MNHLHRSRFNDAPSWRCGMMYLLVASVVGSTVSSSHAHGVPVTSQDSVQARDIWRGLFTDEQAERGRAVFESQCATCHDANQSGEAPALIGGAFLRGWEGRSVGRLYTKIVETMPPNDVQSVGAHQKLDVLAFILQENGFPPGTSELTVDTDALARIRIVPQGGGARLRSGAMVQVVGCLARTSPNAWVLTNSTKPELTTLEQAGTAEPDAGPTRTLGAETVRLLSVFPSPETLVGHRVEAKGLLVRADADVAVNVVALRSVAATCP
jgi:mono/diheme cytochrome c family protein